MRKLINFVIFLLIFDLMFLGVTAIAIFWEHGSSLSILANFGPFAVTAGVLVAILTWLLNSRRSNSDDYLKSAVQLLERAYDVLAILDEHGHPKNTRMNWLASARFLKASLNVSEMITEDTHKKIYKEHLEYWRSQFHYLLIPDDLGKEGFPPEYFAEKTEHLVAFTAKHRAPLSIKSLAVLYRFVKWPENYEDPLSGEKGFNDKEIEEMRTVGPKGLGRLLTEYQEIFRKG